MRSARIAWNGLRTTFVVHVVVGVAAVLASAPIATMLESAVGDHPDGDAVLFAPGGAAWVDVAHGWGAALRAGLVAPLLVGILVAVASAPLTCAWIATLARGAHGANELARHAFALGVRAWALDLLLLVVRALVVAIAIGVAAMVGAIALELTDDRTAGLAALLAFAASLILLVPVGAAADLARAEIALHGRPAHRALWSGIRAAFRTPRRTTLAYAAASALGLVLALLAIAGGELVAGTSMLSAVIVLVVSQSLLLARTFVRSAWLAHVATLNEDPPATR